MKVAIVLEYAQARAWEHAGPWASAFGRALAERGHEVSVFADGVADRARFGDAVRVELRRPDRRSIEADPLGFAAWARERTRAHGGVSLSFSRLFGGDVWMPMGRGPGDELRRLAGLAHRPASLAMQAAPRWWLPLAWAAERRAMSVGRRSVVLSIGEPVRGSRTLEATSPRVVDGWPFGVDRAAVRARLGLSRCEVVVLASAVHHGDAHFGAFLEAAGSVGGGLRVVVVGGRPHLVSRAAERAGAAGCVVPMGQTERMDALIAACDAVAAVGGLSGGRPRGSGRLVAEAVGAGKPVIAAPTAGGVSAVRAALRRGRGLGAVAEDGWDRVLGVAMDPAWRVRAGEAARADRGRFGFERAVEVVEGVLRGRG